MFESVKEVSKSNLKGDCASQYPPSVCQCAKLTSIYALASSFNEWFTVSFHFGGLLTLETASKPSISSLSTRFCIWVAPLKLKFKVLNFTPIGLLLSFVM
jgi:hypothetical protein